MENKDLLIAELRLAHVNSALNNDNLSSNLVKQMAIVGKSFTEALATAILSLGDVHGPTYQARRMLFYTDRKSLIRAINDGVIIPGFGNAFYKDNIDPAWIDFRKILEAEYPENAKQIDEIAELLSKLKGKDLYPNPAAYTAATAHIMDMLPGTEIGLAIAARMGVWAKQWHENTK
jgi:citrate synthase